MAPEPAISARVAVSPGAIRMLGESFQPRPRSRAASAPVPSVAMPPRPFAPSKFSGLIERDCALEMRARLPRLIPRPLNAAMHMLLCCRIDARSGYAARDLCALRDCRHRQRVGAPPGLE